MLTSALARRSAIDFARRWTLKELGTLEGKRAQQHYRAMILNWLMIREFPPIQ